MFNIIDALEFFKKDYSKEILLEILKVIENDGKIVLSFPVQSLSGRQKFNVSRGWLMGFVEDNFNVLDTFTTGGEKFIILKNKK